MDIATAGSVEAIGMVQGVTAASTCTQGTICNVGIAGKCYCDFIDAPSAGNWVFGDGTPGKCSSSVTPPATYPEYLTVMGHALETGSAGIHLILMRGH
jgi:hypothetical protein